MGSGGQTGIKARLKEAVRRPGFVYSHEAIEDIIFREAIAGCVRELNSSGRIADRSIKYVISPQALEAAGRDPGAAPIVSVDHTAEGAAALESGKLYMTVDQNPGGTRPGRRWRQPSIWPGGGPMTTGSGSCWGTTARTRSSLCTPVPVEAVTA